MYIWLFAKKSAGERGYAGRAGIAHVALAASRPLPTATAWCAKSTGRKNAAALTAALAGGSASAGPAGSTAAYATPSGEAAQTSRPALVGTACYAVSSACLGQAGGSARVFCCRATFYAGTRESLPDFADGTERAPPESRPKAGSPPTPRPSAATVKALPRPRRAGRSAASPRLSAPRPPAEG